MVVVVMMRLRMMIDDEDDIDDTQAGNHEASGTNDARLQFRPFVENRWDCPVCWQT